MGALNEQRVVDCVGEKSGARPAGESFKCLPSMFGRGTFENICGASLAAIASAATLRGYTLVWAEPLLDAYLVRSDLLCKGEAPDLSDFAYATNLRIHSPPADPTRSERWLIDFDDFMSRNSHWL